MHQRFVILLLFEALFSQAGFGQNLSGDERLRDIVRQYGQAEVTVSYTGQQELDYLSLNVSILNVRNRLIEISLSPRTVEWFISQKLGYQILEKVVPRTIVSAPNVAGVYAWNMYPTYTQYDSIMRSFSRDYPSLCRLDTIGTSIRGKLVLALKISDNPLEDESEPQVFYTSTMHGDETGGFILMLRLADSLLKNYDVNARVKELSR